VPGRRTLWLHGKRRERQPRLQSLKSHWPSEKGKRIRDVMPEPTKEELLERIAQLER